MESPSVAMPYSSGLILDLRVVITTYLICTLTYSFFRGFTIFPMKSIVFSIVMTIRKGLLKLMVTGTDMGTISMPVAAAASVPVSSTFITAL